MCVHVCSLFFESSFIQDYTQNTFVVIESLRKHLKQLELDLILSKDGLLLLLLYLHTIIDRLIAMVTSSCGLHIHQQIGRGRGKGLFGTLLLQRPVLIQILHLKSLDLAILTRDERDRLLRLGRPIIKHKSKRLEMIMFDFARERGEVEMQLVLLDTIDVLRGFERDLEVACKQRVGINSLIVREWVRCWFVFETRWEVCSGLSIRRHLEELFGQVHGHLTEPVLGPREIEDFIGKVIRDRIGQHCYINVGQDRDHEI